MLGAQRKNEGKNETAEDEAITQTGDKQDRARRGRKCECVSVISFSEHLGMLLGVNANVGCLTVKILQDWFPIVFIISANHQKCS